MLSPAPERVHVLAVLDLDAAVEHVDELLALVRGERALAAGVDDDRNGSMCRALLPGASEKKSSWPASAAPVSRLLQARDRLELVGARDDRAQLRVVVEQRAEPAAERPRDLDERRERRRQLARLELLDHEDVAAAAFGELLDGQPERLPQRRQLDAGPRVARHARPPSPEPARRRRTGTSIGARRGRRRAARRAVSPAG